MPTFLTALFSAISKFFGYLGKKQEAKNMIIQDAGHKEKLKNNAEEDLKDKVEETVKNIRYTTDEEQQKYLEELRKIIAE